MSDLDSLKLEDLWERHTGLTPALSQSFAEAAFVCLSRHHEPPVTVLLNHAGRDELRSIDFAVPDARVRNAYANDTDATEAGAYGVSLAVVEAVVELVAVRRAETQSGADWYLARYGTNAEDLESCIRLEVSGTDEGTSSDIKRRLADKVAQAARGRSNLPAIASVVGFKMLEVAISPLSD